MAGDYSTRWHGGKFPDFIPAANKNTAA